MQTSILSTLRCPVCASTLTADATQKSCRCEGERSHCFDFSRSGYLHLGGARVGEGDGKDAVRARRAFLDAGYYQPLSDAVNAMCKDLGVMTVLDAGCGEGYYTNRLAVNHTVLGVDLSKEGIDLAAKRARSQQTNAGFAVASLFTLPVKEGAFDALINLFAPCAEEEFCRVLKDDGYLILVGAGEEHLMGLKRVLYDTPYLNPGRADLPKQMKRISTKRLKYSFTVEGEEQIMALFSMTPYYWRTSEADKAKLVGLNQLTTEADFDIFLFRKGNLT